MSPFPCFNIILLSRWGWSVAVQGQVTVLELTSQVIRKFDLPISLGLYVRVKNYLAWIRKHAASGACVKTSSKKRRSIKKKKKKSKKKKRKKRRRKKKRKKKRRRSRRG